MTVLNLHFWWFCCLLISLGSGSTHARAQVLDGQVLKLTQAQVVYNASQTSTPEKATQSLAWQAVRLPDSWVGHVPGLQGLAYYRLTFDSLPTWREDDRLFLYIPRVGNRFSVHLNGHPIGASGELTQVAEDHAHEPQGFDLPIEILQPQSNVLLLEVHGELGRYAGLSEVWVGPTRLVKPLYVFRKSWQNGGALVVVVLALIIGLLALGFGVVMGARVQIIFGLAAVCWGIRNTYMLVTVPPLPHPWWGVLIDLLYGAAIVLLSFSILLTLRKKNIRTSAILGFMLVATLVMPALYGCTGIFAFRQNWLLILLGGVALVSGVVLRHGWRVRNFDSNVLSLSALIALGLALYDHFAILYMASGYSNLALAKFAFLFILLAMSVLLMRRVFRSINTAKRFRVRLQSRLDRAGALISRFHDEREKKRVQEAEMAERMRLLQEMHDGVGAHLVVLHCMVRNAGSSRLDMENQLSQASLALRDSLDTLHGEPQTWLMVLVKLRDTLESRLAHAGIELSWQVENLGELPMPSLDAQRHFRLLLSECITNVIKHSSATQVEVRAFRETDSPQSGWVLRLSDDGCGLSGSKTSGYGMPNMLAHAKAMSAQLRVTDRFPGTCIEIGFLQPS